MAGNQNSGYMGGSGGRVSVIPGSFFFGYARKHSLLAQDRRCGGINNGENDIF
jgi:hypothetical protein